MLNAITPLIITFNEAPNIRRTLKKLTWARKIIVVDSGSTDETVDILTSFSQVEVIYREFRDFASQCNFGISHVTTPWVLSLDADYELSDELITEIQSLAPSDEIAGYRSRFVYRIYGRALRGSLYPSRTVLYRKDWAAYRNEGHGHRVSVRGTVLTLTSPIYHDDRKSLSDWFGAQQRYARKEAEHLISSSRSSLSRIDQVRLYAWPAPLAVLIYTLFVKGCLLDGWAGWFYALQRMLAEIMIALELVSKQLSPSENSDG